MNAYILYWLLCFLLPTIFILLKIETDYPCDPPPEMWTFSLVFVLVIFLIVSIIYIIKKRIKAGEVVGFIVFNVIIFVLFGYIFINIKGASCPPKDAKIKADLSQMQSAAEVYRVKNNTYSLSSFNVDVSSCDTVDTFVATNTDGDKACDDAVKQLKGGLIIRINNAKDVDAKYCVQKTLNVGGSFCVDSTGYNGPDDGCDNINFSCEDDN
jgi:hypothetical protein